MTKTRQFNRKQFIEKFDPLHAGFLRDKIGFAEEHIHDETVRNALEQSYEIFGLRGKRFRPYALYLMYVSVGGDNYEEAALAGIGVELQHAFALIHDDIIDRGDLRHGLPTIHELIKERLVIDGTTVDIEHLANAQAMLIGDLMLSWSYAALNDSQNPQKDRVLKQLQDMTTKLIIGEMIDVSLPLHRRVSDDELAERDAFKTTAYTFVYPLLMGATLAGKEEEYASFCNTFGSYMGEVYQIQDDILDILGELGTPAHSDIREHQHTYLTQYVFAHGTQSDIRTLETFFASKAADQENEKQVLEIVSRSEVIEAAKAKTAKLLVQAKKVLHDAEFAGHHEDLWLEVIGFFEHRFDN